MLSSSRAALILGSFSSFFFLNPPLFWQGRIDVRSSRPPVREDEVDRDARRRSAEKSKSAKDSKKKGEKKKNLDRQALEARRSKSRQRGEPEEESPSDEDDDDGEDSDDSEGMASRLDRILEDPARGDVDAPRTEALTGGPGGYHRPRAVTPPAPAAGQVAPRPPPVPKTGGQARPQAMGSLTRGRAAASEKGESVRRSASPGVRQAEATGPRPAPVFVGSGTSTRGGSRPTSRGTGRRAVLPMG